MVKNNDISDDRHLTTTMPEKAKLTDNRKGNENNGKNIVNEEGNFELKGRKRRRAGATEPIESTKEAAKTEPEVHPAFKKKRTVGKKKAENAEIVHEEIPLEKSNSATIELKIETSSNENGSAKEQKKRGGRKKKVVETSSTEDVETGKEAPKVVKEKSPTNVNVVEVKDVKQKAMAPKAATRKVGPIQLTNDLAPALKFDGFKSLLQDYFLSSDLTPTDLGEVYFEWLINPTTKDVFYQRHSETEPLFISRNKSRASYYDGLFSTKDLETIVDQNDLTYGTNIDLAKYEDDERVTLNPEGRVYSSVMWDFYNNGTSIRLLNPQTFSKHVWRLTSVLQQFFATFVGCNLYLTPPNSQGFAPHYDDIDAFILQLEGKKRWSLYRSEPDSVLPRFSSVNFKRDDLGPLWMTVDLSPGDLLYMPRGCVHEAHCLDDKHSLHLTISAGQLNTYADLFTLIMPQAVKIASESDVEFRRALPQGSISYMGTAFEEGNVKKEQRKYLETHVSTLMKKLRDFLPLDDGFDLLAKKYIHESQPLCIMPNDYPSNLSISTSKLLSWNESLGKPEKSKISINLLTKIRLTDRYCLRIVCDETDVDMDAVVYYNVNNSRVYKEKEIQRFDATAIECEAIEHLIKSFPKFCSVDSLPLDAEVDKISLANCLFELGLIITQVSQEKPGKGK